jgi:hypothetical protein
MGQLLSGNHSVWNTDQLWPQCGWKTTFKY